MSTNASRKKTSRSTGKKSSKKKSSPQPSTSVESVWEMDQSQLAQWFDIWPEAESMPLIWNQKQTIKNQPEFSQLNAWLKFLKLQKKAASPVSSEKSLQLIQEILIFLNETIQEVPRLLAQPAKEDTPDAEDQTKQKLAAIGLSSVCAAWLIPLIKDKVEGKHLESCRHALLALASAEIGFNHQPILHQLLKVELPLVINLHFPSDVMASEIWPQMESDLADGMEEVLDGNGIPSAEYLPIFGDLVATWTRCMGIAIHLERPIFDPEPEIQFQWTIRQFLRLLRSDKKLLGGSSENKVGGDFCIAALKASDDEEDWEFSRVLLPKLIKKFPVDKRQERKPIGKNKEPLIHASDNSEWAKIAVLRSDWTPKSDKILIDYSQEEHSIKIENSHDWIDGKLGTEISVDEKPIELANNWTEVCWDTDDYYSYLELQTESTDGSVALQRQFMLSLDYRFLWIGDFVNCSEEVNNQLTHRWSFQSAEDCQVLGEKENTELHLVNGNHRLNIFPMCLPEWKTESARGSLEPNANGFQLSYQLPASKLYNAVLIDLDKKRCKRPYTWRQLMVAENLEPVALNRATGFRAQLDRMQFLFYRNLGEIKSQTVLGQNYYCDFFSGYFTPAGTCDEIVMINGHVEDDDDE